jgi:phosphoadenosine phosphosulfate reductase
VNSIAGRRLLRRVHLNGFQMAAPGLDPTPVLAGASMADRAALLDRDFRGLDLAGRLRRLRDGLSGRITFTTSFGLEDQVIAHVLFDSGIEIDIVTLDTGRLFPETYKLWSDTEARYGRRIRALNPNAAALEALIADQGIDGFYYGVEMRKACCGIRKVDPLARALAGAAGWVTGLRADQSAHRQDLDYVSWDEGRRLVKANPVFDWSRGQALAFAEANRIPVNPLHGQGFLSIGCAPCTRAVRPGEPERAGRWWWEDENQKECGLHVSDDGRMTRALDRQTS